MLVQSMGNYESIKTSLFFDFPVAFANDFFDSFLLNAAKNSVSDITITEGNGIKLDRHGVIYTASRVLNAQEVDNILIWIYNSANAKSEILQRRPLDNRYVIKYDKNKRFYFRYNAIGCFSVYRSQGVHITLRTIPQELPLLANQKLNEQLQRDLLECKGAVAIVGETGQGKTTLLAALMRHIIENTVDEKVVAFEAPAEFDMTSLVTERSILVQSDVGEFGTHLNSFAAAIRAALRQKPTSILLGEARDLETIDGVLLAAESGHKTFFTVHAGGVAQTLQRMSEEYPTAQSEQMIYKLVGVMGVICCQRLVKLKNGQGRMPIREWLYFDSEFKESLLREKTGHEILNKITEKVKEKGQLFRQQAIEAYRNDLIADNVLVSFGVKPSDSLLTTQ